MNKLHVGDLFPIRSHWASPTNTAGVRRHSGTMRSRIAGFVALGLALTGQWGCGGSSTPSAPTPVAAPAPAPTPQPPQVLLERSFSLPSGFIGSFRGVSVTSSGVLTVTVDWTFATNDLDAFLVRGLCTEEMYDAGTCDFIAFTDSPTAKPEMLAVNLTPGTYTPMVANFGPDDESGSVQVVFTGGATASSASSAKTRIPKSPVRFIPPAR